MNRFDVIVIGGGIVGVATAWQLKRRLPSASILLVDKEHKLASHQTGHNSGVIHAGVYYQPGSLKADFCKRGAVATMAFCREHNIPVKQCGKLLVATDDKEHGRMAALKLRCQENKIACESLNSNELKKREPQIRGLGALFIEATGITDYRLITEKMADCFTACGGKILKGAEVRTIDEKAYGVIVQAGEQSVHSQYLVVCGGLNADRLALMMGIDIDFRIIPFRGEYYRLPKSCNDIVTHLIYPVPDPELPFLGVHLTRMIDGSVTVGPNAVLGWKREGYGDFNFDIRDVMMMINYPGFWRVLRNHFSSGLAEMRDSYYKRGYLKRVQKYCPGIRLKDLRPYPAGVRAQAVRSDGSLVHDFLFARSARSLHVCNAPSPAATSALPISEHLCAEALELFGL